MDADNQDEEVAKSKVADLNQYREHKEEQEEKEGRVVIMKAFLAHANNLGW